MRRAVVCLILCAAVAACGRSRRRNIGRIPSPDAAPGPALPIEEQCAGEGPTTGKACYELAMKTIRGDAKPRGEAPDPARDAMTLLSRSCDYAYPPGCETLGQRIRDGQGVPADPKRGNEILARACDLGAASACGSAGLAAARSGDTERAVKLLEKACQGRDGLGCATLGSMLRHGQGVPADPVKGTDYLSKGCDLGNRAACAELGR